MRQVKNKSFLAAIVLTAAFILPGVVSAAVLPYWPSETTPLISCGGTSGVNCDLCQLIQTSKNVIRFAMTLLIAVFAPIMLVYGGIMIMISRGSPEQFGKGRKALTGAVIGIVVGLGAFLIIDQFVKLLGVNLGQGKPKRWYEFTCPSSIIPKPTPPTTGGGGPSSTNDGTFYNGPSSELNSLISCLQGKLPSARVTSITDSNIPATCNPADPGESFNDPANCQHAKNSCHYGGSKCQSRGSFAVDVGQNQPRSDPSASQISNAAKQCLSGAWVNNEGDHVHVSIGNAYGCGCS